MAVLWGGGTMAVPWQCHRGGTVVALWQYLEVPWGSVPWEQYCGGTVAVLWGGGTISVP